MSFATALLRAIYVAFALFLFACTPPPIQAKSNQSELAKILTANLVDELGISGLAVSIGKNDAIIWSTGVGLADMEQHVLISPSKTKFRIGSVSKPLTAMAIAKLYEEGKLDLDAPIQQYVSYFPVKEQGPVTTRQLAGHLAGIRGYAEGEYYNTQAYSSVEEAISLFMNDPLESPPGTTHRYTSYGYNLMSAVIEGATEQNFLDYMSENIFAPLGMSSTLADHVVPIISNRARPYDKEENALINSPWVDNSVKWAGGGFLSTSDDLARFGLAHFSSKALSINTINLLWTSQKTASGENTNYGIGWRIRVDDAGRKIVYHGGSAVGGTADLHLYPAEKLVIVTLSNTSPDAIPIKASHRLVDELAALFLAVEPDTRDLK